MGGWRGWASSPGAALPPDDGGSFGGRSTLVKPLTFNSHLSSNVFHMCVPVVFRGGGIDLLQSFGIKSPRH